jgi:hypothetical protein
MKYVFISFLILIIYTAIVIVYSILGISLILLLSLFCNVNTIKLLLKYYSIIFHLLTFNNFKDGR